MKPRIDPQGNGFEVDFVVNCYERTYREVLQPGYIAQLADSQLFPFVEITALVNNVVDRPRAEQMATRLLAEDPHVTRVLFVEDHLSRALAIAGLRDTHLKHLKHFTDCCLVAVTLPGPDWLCYWDADARLRTPHDWLSPVLALMNSDPQHAVGNPNNWHVGLAEKEAHSFAGDDIAIGYGFSDVAFVARRADLARRIYRSTCPASWRYPLAHIEPVFEQRIDAWMRRSGRTRITYLPATIEHISEAGTNYPRNLTPKHRAKRWLFNRIVPRLDAHLSHPAFAARPTRPRRAPSSRNTWQ